MSRILVLDIETQPITALVWGLFNQNISLSQIRDPGGIICIGLKWLGEKKTYLYSVWEHGFEEMIRQTHAMIMEADAVVSYNGNRFDIPKIRGACVEVGLVLPPVTSIDVYMSVKKLGLISSKLAFVGPFLQIGKKLQTGGMELWIGCMDGDEKSQNKMGKYCVQDVVLLEKVHNGLLPHLVNYPNIGGGKDSCPKCGSKDSQKRGYRFTKLMRIQRHSCNKCNSFFDGARTKV